MATKILELRPSALTGLNAGQSLPASFTDATGSRILNVYATAPVYQRDENGVPCIDFAGNGGLTLSGDLGLFGHTKITILAAFKKTANPSSGNHYIWHSNAVTMAYVNTDGTIDYRHFQVAYSTARMPNDTGKQLIYIEHDMEKSGNEIVTRKNKVTNTNIIANGDNWGSFNIGDLNIGCNTGLGVSSSAQMRLYYFAIYRGTLTTEERDEFERNVEADMNGNAVISPATAYLPGIGSSKTFTAYGTRGETFWDIPVGSDKCTITRNGNQCTVTRTAVGPIQVRCSSNPWGTGTIGANDGWTVLRADGSREVIQYGTTKVYSLNIVLNANNDSFTFSGKGMTQLGGSSYMLVSASNGTGGYGNLAINTAGTEIRYLNKGNNTVDAYTNGAFTANYSIFYNYFYPTIQISDAVPVGQIIPRPEYSGSGITGYSEAVTSLSPTITKSNPAFPIGVPVTVTLEGESEEVFFEAVRGATSCIITRNGNSATITRTAPGFIRIKAFTTPWSTGTAIGGNYNGCVLKDNGDWVVKTSAAGTFNLKPRFLNDAVCKFYGGTGLTFHWGNANTNAILRSFSIGWNQFINYNPTNGDRFGYGIYTDGTLVQSDVTMCPMPQYGQITLDGNTPVGSTIRKPDIEYAVSNKGPYTSSTVNDYKEFYLEDQTVASVLPAEPTFTQGVPTVLTASGIGGSGTLKFEDTFNRADGALGNGWITMSGGQWTAPSGSIVSQQMVLNNTSTDSGFMRPETMANGSVSIDVVARSGGGGPVLLLRCQDSLNYYFMPFTNSSGFGTRIYKGVGGGMVLLASNNDYTVMPGDRVEFEAKGTVLKGYVTRNGVRSEVVTATDSSYATGSPGFGCDYTSLTLDNLRVIDYDAGVVWDIVEGVTCCTIQRNGAQCTITRTKPGLIKVRASSNPWASETPIGASLAGRWKLQQDGRYLITALGTGTIQDISAAELTADQDNISINSPGTCYLPIVMRGRVYYNYIASENTVLNHGKHAADRWYANQWNSGGLVNQHIVISNPPTQIGVMTNGPGQLPVGTYIPRPEIQQNYGVLGYSEAIVEHITDVSISPTTFNASVGQSVVFEATGVGGDVSPKFRDSFNRADGAIGNGWNALTGWQWGNPPNATISGHRLSFPRLHYWAGYYRADNIKNVSVSMDVNEINQYGILFVARKTPDGSFYLARFGNTTNTYIYLIIGGASAYQLAELPLSSFKLQPFDRPEFVVEGNVLKLFNTRDGVRSEILSYTDLGNNITAAGEYGFGTEYAMDLVIDNFEARDLDASVFWDIPVGNDKATITRNGKQATVTRTAIGDISVRASSNPWEGSPAPGSTIQYVWELQADGRLKTVVNAGYGFIYTASKPKTAGQRLYFHQGLDGNYDITIRNLWNRQINSQFPYGRSMQYYSNWYMERGGPTTMNLYQSSSFIGQLTAFPISDRITFGLQQHPNIPVGGFIPRPDVTISGEHKTTTTYGYSQAVATSQIPIIGTAAITNFLQTAAATGTVLNPRFATANITNVLQTVVAAGIFPKTANVAIINPLQTVVVAANTPWYLNTVITNPKQTAASTGTFPWMPSVAIINPKPIVAVAAATPWYLATNIFNPVQAIAGTSVFIALRTANVGILNPIQNVDISGFYAPWVGPLAKFVGTASLIPVNDFSIDFFFLNEAVVDIAPVHSDIIDIVRVNSDLITVIDLTNGTV